MAEQYVGVRFKTLFEGLDFDYHEARSSIIKEITGLDKLGLLDKQNGNLSIRVKDGMVITPAAKYLADMRQEDMVLVKGIVGRDIVRAVGHSSPSSEARMHWMIYEKFPKVGAIVHFHDSKLLGGVKFPQTSKEVPYGTLELANEVLTTLESSKKSFIIMKNHGAIAVGKDIEACHKLVEKAERG